VIRFGVRVARKHAQTALFLLLARSPGGVEEIDLDAGTVEYVLYGSREALPDEAELRGLLGDGLRGIDRREIGDDWQERWREFHQPVSVAERFRVRAPWHEPAEGALIELVIEPGQAFGTGAHATTRMCLELLAFLEGTGAARGALLDLGCGSGVLAIAAAKLGFAPVLAIDNDPLALQASAQNATLNGVRLDVCGADLATDALPPAETIVANLLLEPLLVLAERIAKPPRRLIASGLLEHQADALTARLQGRLGLRERERRGEGEWLAILYERGPQAPYPLV
jgi:ribosomal protein L11 methyltransferase